MTIELKGPNFKHQNQDIERICIFFHGWGSNGDDLISLAPIMSKYLPEMLFVSPNAPEICDMNPDGRQWFNIMDREKGIDSPISSIEKYIRNIKLEYGVSNSKIFLFGFSQGAMIALHYGLRADEKFAGILAYSGSLISPNRISEIRNNTPVMIIHGELDDVVPFDEMEKASIALEKHNLNVEKHSIPNLGHGINDFGIQKAIDFMKKFKN